MSGNHLLQDHLLTLEQVRGCRIECNEGRLWLTADGEDIVLEQGESWLVASDQRVVIESLTDSHYTLHTRYAEQFELLRHTISILHESWRQLRHTLTPLRRPAH
ncbi:DUF2917 domain-containing protein [Chitinilyticum litopenaei]|uniref:DUF2917 domain-containing protein n=1 Tax=Chitinilyticum litopenaei TaxID=1121276 RepID=UPI00130DBE22|nr:DUF2917 domain-containing protein [Chitinilyticum litopenaei]